MPTIHSHPDASDRCNIGKVLAHAKSMTDSCPTLKVQLEGPANWKEWEHEYSKMLFKDCFVFEISYKHYIDKKLTLHGAVSSDVKSYYRGKKKDQLKRLAGAIDAVLRTLVLNNINKEKLHFHETPDGNHTYEDLRAQVKKACSRDPLMIKVAEFRSFSKSLLNNAQTVRHAVIYGFTDWKLQVLAGIHESRYADDRLLRKIIQALDESNLDEDYTSIINENDIDKVPQLISRAIDEVIVLVKKTLGDVDGSIHENVQIMSTVGNCLVERIRKLAESKRSTKGTARASNQYVTSPLKWELYSEYHTVRDASLLWDAREAYVCLWHGIGIRTLIGKLRVQFPSGLSVWLKNAAYVPYVTPTYASPAAGNDGLFLYMSSGELFLQNTGEKLCDVTEHKGFFINLKFERQISCKTSLIVTSKDSTPNPHSVGQILYNYGNDEVWGANRASSPQELQDERALLRLHRKYGHPDAEEFRLLRHHTKPEKSFSRDQCMGCLLAVPEINLTDHLTDFTNASLPMKITHISIQEMNEPAYDGSRFFLTLVDENTYYATGFLLKNKGEAVSRLESYLKTSSALHKVDNFQICNDHDSEIGPSIQEFCDSHEISLVSPHPYTMGGTKSIAYYWGEVIVEKARCLICDAGAPMIFWPAAVRLAVNQTNSCPTKLLDGDIPLHKWGSFSGTNVTLPKLAVFGSMVHFKVPKKGKRIGCYLGPSADNTRHLVLSHDSAKVTEVIDFEEDNGFFFKNCRLEVSGQNLNARDLDVLNSLIQRQGIRSWTTSAKEREHQRSVLEGIFEYEQWQGRDNQSVSTPGSDDSSDYYEDEELY